MISFIAHWAGNGVPSAGLRHHRESLLDTRSALERGADQLERIRTRLDLRQEPESSHLDAQDRAVRLGGHARGPQERPVATDGDDQVGRVVPHVLGAPREPVGDLASASSCRRSVSAVSTARRATLVHDERHEAHDVASSPAALDRAVDVERSSIRTPTRACSRNSTLPAGPVIGRDDHAAAGAPPAARSPRRRRAIARRQTAGSATTPPRSDLSRPASNWGLIEEDEVRVRLGDRRRAGRRTERSEMNERSAVTSDGRIREHLGTELADVRPVEDRDARVGSELPRELAVADVEGDDVPRAALQQAVGESARRRPRVEAVTSGGIDRERVEGGGELLPSAGDERARRPLARRAPRRLPRASCSWWPARPAPSRAPPGPPPAPPLGCRRAHGARARRRGGGGPRSSRLGRARRLGGGRGRLRVPADVFFALPSSGLRLLPAGRGHAGAPLQVAYPLAERVELVLRRRRPSSSSARRPLSGPRRRDAARGRSALPRSSRPGPCRRPAQIALRELLGLVRAQARSELRAIS